jgi:hypothetical protein
MNVTAAGRKRTLYYRPCAWVRAHPDRPVYRLVHYADDDSWWAERLRDSTWEPLGMYLIFLRGRTDRRWPRHFGHGGKGKAEADVARREGMKAQ